MRRIARHDIDVGGFLEDFGDSCFFWIVVSTLLGSIGKTPVFSNADVVFANVKASIYEA